MGDWMSAPAPLLSSSSSSLLQQQQQDLLPDGGGGIRSLSSSTAAGTSGVSGPTAVSRLNGYAYGASLLPPLQFPHNHTSSSSSSSYHRHDTKRSRRIIEKAAAAAAASSTSSMGTGDAMLDLMPGQPLPLRSRAALANTSSSTVGGAPVFTSRGLKVQPLARSKRDLNEDGSGSDQNEDVIEINTSSSAAAAMYKGSHSSENDRDGFYPALDSDTQSHGALAMLEGRHQHGYNSHHHHHHHHHSYSTNFARIMLPPRPSDPIFRLGNTRLQLIQDFFTKRNLYCSSFPVLEPSVFFNALYSIRLEALKRNVSRLAVLDDDEHHADDDGHHHQVEDAAEFDHAMDLDRDDALPFHPPRLHGSISPLPLDGLISSGTGGINARSSNSGGSSSHLSAWKSRALAAWHESKESMTTMLRQSGGGYGSTSSLDSLGLGVGSSGNAAAAAAAYSGMQSGGTVSGNTIENGLGTKRMRAPSIESSSSSQDFGMNGKSSSALHAPPQQQQLRHAGSYYASHGSSSSSLSSLWQGVGPSPPSPNSATKQLQRQSQMSGAGAAAINSSSGPSVLSSPLNDAHMALGAPSGRGISAGSAPEMGLNINMDLQSSNTHPGASQRGTNYANARSNTTTPSPRGPGARGGRAHSISVGSLQSVTNIASIAANLQAASLQMQQGANAGSSSRMMNHGAHKWFKRVGSNDSLDELLGISASAAGHGSHGAPAAGAGAGVSAPLHFAAPHSNARSAGLHHQQQAAALLQGVIDSGSDGVNSVIGGFAHASVTPQQQKRSSVGVSNSHGGDHNRASERSTSPLDYLTEISALLHDTEGHPVHGPISGKAAAGSGNTGGSSTGGRRSGSSGSRSANEAINSASGVLPATDMPSPRPFPAPAPPFPTLSASSASAAATATTHAGADAAPANVRAQHSRNSNDEADEVMRALEQLEAEESGLTDDVDDEENGSGDDESDDADSDNGANAHRRSNKQHNSRKHRSSRSSTSSSSMVSALDADSFAFRVLYLSVMACGAVAEGRPRLAWELYSAARLSLGPCFTTPSKYLVPALVLLSILHRNFFPDWRQTVCILALARQMTELVDVPSEIRMLLDIQAITSPDHRVSKLPPLVRPPGEGPLLRMANIIDYCVSLIMTEYSEWKLEVSSHEHVRALLTEALGVHSKEERLRGSPLRPFVRGIYSLLAFAASEYQDGVTASQSCIDEASVHPLGPHSGMLALLIYRLVTHMRDMVEAAVQADAARLQAAAGTGAVDSSAQNDGSSAAAVADGSPRALAPGVAGGVAPASIIVDSGVTSQPQSVAADHHGPGAGAGGDAGGNSPGAAASNTGFDASHPPIVPEVAHTASSWPQHFGIGAGSGHSHHHGHPSSQARGQHAPHHASNSSSSHNTIWNKGDYNTSGSNTASTAGLAPSSSLTSANATSSSSPAPSALALSVPPAGDAGGDTSAASSPVASAASAAAGAAAGLTQAVHATDGQEHAAPPRIHLPLELRSRIVRVLVKAQYYLKNADKVQGNFGVMNFALGPATQRMADELGLVTSAGAGSSRGSGTAH